MLHMKLAPGSKWRANPDNLPGPLVLLAVDAGAGFVPVGPTEAKKGRTVGARSNGQKADAPSPPLLPPCLQRSRQLRARKL
jgi:hypothetical protein